MLKISKIIINKNLIMQWSRTQEFNSQDSFQDVQITEASDKRRATIMNSNFLSYTQKSNPLNFTKAQSRRIKNKSQTYVKNVVRDKIEIENSSLYYKI